MSYCGWDHVDPCTIVTIGDVEAISNGRQWGHGLISLDGWEGGAPAEGGPSAYENADGSLAGDVYYGPRSIIIEGDTYARSHQDLVYMVADLSNLGRYETLTVDETVHAGLVRQMQVARLRPVQISYVSPTWAVWTMTLVSQGWKRLGVDAQSATITSAGVALQNLGTAPAALTLTLTGPLTNPGISWSGGAWQYSGTVASGTTLTVDLERRIVRNPATSAHSRRLASGTWLQLPPGSTTVSRTGSGSGSISASWRSSWA